MLNTCLANVLTLFNPYKQLKRKDANIFVFQFPWFMRKIILLAVCIFLINSLLFSQKVAGTVKGAFIDSSSADGLADATISVITQKDSSLISFTLSSNSGYFEIKNLDTGAYVLLFSYQGYPNFKKQFAISAAHTIADLGKVKIAQEYKMLGEVIVKDETPIKVKGDTIAYNADAFKVLKPNATAEDLLKKLPGIQVERDGTVKAQGENVQKIYVDGKEFFGNDPKLATKNLTADMIDQVELYDDMSEQAKFTGMDDGSRSKAINLKLKKNKNKGTFGRAMAGYGTDDRYQANLSANYFKGATKVSLIARSNNTNNVGFTNNDMIGGFGGGSSGITKNSTAGVNYSDLWGNKLELTTSYFFNHTNNFNNSNSVRVTDYNTKSGGDSTVRRNAMGLSDNNNDNHRINLRMIYTIDSMSSIIYTPRINFQSSSSIRRDSTWSYDIDDAPYMVGDSWSERNNTGSGFSWTNDITYRRKFRKRGRSFSVNLTNTYNTTDRDALYISRIGNFKDGEKASEQKINQKTIQENGTENYGVSVSYTEPIARDKVLEFNYAYNKNSNESDREVYEYNDASEKFDVKNLLQTNLFENANESNRIGTNYRVVKKKYNYQLGMAVQRTLLQSNNLSKNTFIEQSYTNLFPTAIFNYRFARSKNLRFNYRGRTSQPGTSQLQETLDQSNALYWSKGNAALNQEYSNNISLNYNSFDMVKFRNFFLRFNFSNTLNKIVNNVITDTAAIRAVTGLPYNEEIARGVQLTRPVNASGAYNFGGNINVGFPINSMKGGNFNTSTFFNNSRDVSFIDNVKNYTKNLSLGESLRLSYTYKEKLDVGIGTSVQYNQVTNTFRREQNSKYYTYSASADISYIFPRNFILSTDVDYYTNTGLADGYNQAYTLWNASFSKQMLKNQRGELKLSVFDLLKQNRSISRNFSENYIEDVQNSVVRQFFMLSFTYNLNRMGSSVNNRMQGAGGGRNYFRMMQ